ncbi:Uncharacterized protein PECH_008506 [Penicillium ucsense]|uniref:HECT-type E3 ubiquitin transferase n=1 Tax=Penicillium ucsense TaxID=2839758 RepID=A0A8J8W5U4_9EURO|nr:Uncharacterized protein PECM_006406 [Penicillium ucsense]KAF7734112.1 Uncharacterized protein PECH_008506 [Penicillium ucsense]
MTRLHGASLENPNTVDPRGCEQPQYCRSKVPPNAPDIVVQNTIEVTDPSRVLPWYRDERRRDFNWLVRSYKHQLLWGCGNPTCQTPSCASRRRRTADGPYRRYTELSARTLACYLASQDNPESGLCRNNSHFLTESRSNGQLRQFQQRSRTTKSTENDRRSCQGPRVRDEGDSLDARSTRNVDEIADRKTTHTDPSAFVFDHHESGAEQHHKDPKSFTQNLFDTLSLRMVEWLPLRNDTESIPSKGQPPMRRKSQDSRVSENPRGKPSGQPHRASRSPSSLTTKASTPRTPSSRSSVPNPTAVELTFQNQHVRRLSIPDSDHRRQTSRNGLDEKKRLEYKGPVLSLNAQIASEDYSTITSPPPLKHRPQKHRGRTSEPEEAGSKDRIKGQRRVSWDSEKLFAETACNENSKSRHPPPCPSNSDIDTPTHRRPKHSSLRRTRAVPPLAQSLSHFTPEIIDGLKRLMISSEEDAEAWQEELDRMQFTGNFENPDWRYATPSQRQAFPFLAQSTFFILGNSTQTLQSFGRDGVHPDQTSNKMSKSLDVARLRAALQHLFSLCPWDIALHSLWNLTEKLFVPPDDVTYSARPSRRSSRSSTMSSAPPIVRRLSETANNDHLSDADAAYIATITFFVLISTVPSLDNTTWRGLLRMRASGKVASAADLEKLGPELAQKAMDATDQLEHDLGLRLIHRLVRALVARLAYSEITKARQIYSLDAPKQRRANVLDRIIDHLSEQQAHHLSTGGQPESPSPIALIVEWLRTLLLREWDGNPELSRSSAAGGAVQILALMYQARNRLGLLSEDFHTPILAERLDPLELPVSWLDDQSNNRSMHLLTHSFLFPPSTVVTYFRALNYSVMCKYVESATATGRHLTQTALHSISISNEALLLDRMKVSTCTYLVLVIRRDNVLTDALNQLWRREKRELMRPLKVQMGMDEGEEGLDHGGVQQEFFRVLMGEALDPAYGMFTLDNRSRSSWFRPRSWEPLYKFELLGLLMSIAVYNAITLPVNFPLAFYRKLLGLKIKSVDHIRDGWPELSHGLEMLLNWEDGDVADVFVRTYEFSFKNAGQLETIDMQKVGRDGSWPISHSKHDNVSTRSTSSSDEPQVAKPDCDDHPSTDDFKCANFNPTLLPSPAKSVHSSQSQPSPSPTIPDAEAPLVTNQNRAQYVKDYIFWLTDKTIRPQFEAFARGFFTCLDRSTLSIFTPEALKAVVEGIQEIDLTELEHHARYEGGFGPNHRVIRDFWSVVHGYSAVKKAQLLEFVTASDRVPVNGISTIMFVIQKNGVGDLRLPTSLTCFGRLLLPEYSSKEALSQKLDKALENTRGFGVA